MKLKLGQILYIKNIPYKTISMIECEKQKIERYEILSLNNSTILWLFIINVNTDTEKYYIFDNCELQINKDNQERFSEQNSNYLEKKFSGLSITKFYGNIPFIFDGAYALSIYAFPDKCIILESWKNLYYGCTISNLEIKITQNIDKSLYDQEKYFKLFRTLLLIINFIINFGTFCIILIVFLFGIIQ